MLFDKEGGTFILLINWNYYLTCVNVCMYVNVFIHQHNFVGMHRLCHQSDIPRLLQRQFVCFRGVLFALTILIFRH